MKPDIQREADDLAADVADFAAFVAEEHGPNEAREFLDRIMARVNEIQLPANSSLGELLTSGLIQ